MVIGMFANININPRSLIQSAWVHDKAHELLLARLRAIKSFEKQLGARTR